MADGQAAGLAERLEPVRRDLDVRRLGASSMSKRKR